MKKSGGIIVLALILLGCVSGEKPGIRLPGWIIGVWQSQDSSSDKVSTGSLRVEITESSVILSRTVEDSTPPSSTEDSASGNSTISLRDILQFLGFISQESTPAKIVVSTDLGRDLQAKELEKTDAVYSIESDAAAFDTNKTWRWEAIDSNTIEYWPQYETGARSITLKRVQPAEEHGFPHLMDKYILGPPIDALTGWIGNSLHFGKDPQHYARVLAFFLVIAGIVGLTFSSSLE